MAKILYCICKRKSLDNEVVNKAKRLAATLAPSRIDTSLVIQLADGCSAMASWSNEARLKVKGSSILLTSASQLGAIAMRSLNLIPESS